MGIKTKNFEFYSDIPEKLVLDRDTSKKLTGYASIDRPWEKFYSREALEAKIPEMTAYQYMCSENHDNLDAYAIEYYGTKITFDSFIRKIDNACDKFYSLGVRKGDVVTILSLTNPELIIAFYALNKLGAVVNLIDVRSDANKIKEYLNEVNSRILISLDNFLPEVDKIVDETSVEKVITVSPFNSIPFALRVAANLNDKLKNRQLREKIDSIKKKPKYMTWNEFIGMNSQLFVIGINYEPNQLAVLVHTGGTTGVSKTVKLSNDNFNAMAIQYKSLNTGYNKKDTFLNGIVPFVAYGIVTTIHMPMCLGITNIVAPILSPKEFTEFMIKYKPNHTATVPSYIDDFINSERVRLLDWSDLKHIGIGGDRLSLEKEKEIIRFLKLHNSSASLDKGYGMTELSSSVVSCMGEINKLLSLGIPLPQNNIGIFKENSDCELEYGEEGEICITGPTMMLGYLNNLEEENKVIRIHSDGTKWVHSGDLGKLDEEGFLYLVGRIKRMIVHGGFKLYPTVMESVIMKCGDVDNCCVISIPSLEFGSSPEAHVVLKKDRIRELSEIKREILEICLCELPEYSQPDDIIFVDELPITTVGKVDYKKVEKGRVLKLSKEGK